MVNLNIQYPKCVHCGINFREDEDRLLIMGEPMHDACFTDEDEIRIAIDDYSRMSPLWRRFWRELWKEKQHRIYEAIMK